MPITPIAGAYQKFAIGAVDHFFDGIRDYFTPFWIHGTDELSVDELIWTRWQIEYSRETPTGTSEDRALFKLDIVNMTGGDLDASWSSTDYSDVQTIIDLLIVALRPYQSAAHKAQQHTAHLMHFQPETWPEKRFRDTGPPTNVRVITPVAGAGTAQAYQVAGTVTFKTAIPKHWGRAYLPGLAVGALDSNGRLTSTARSGILTAFTDAAAALKAKDFYLVIPTTQVDKAPAFALQSVSAIVVDDVPDVQRRRRPKQVGARSSAGLS